MGSAVVLYPVVLLVLKLISSRWGDKGKQISDLAEKMQDKVEETKRLERKEWERKRQEEKPAKVEPVWSQEQIDREIKRIERAREERMLEEAKRKMAWNAFSAGALFGLYGSFHSDDDWPLRDSRRSSTHGCGCTCIDCLSGNHGYCGDEDDDDCDCW